MIWYPYTQMKKMKTPWTIVDAEGVYIKTEDKALIDSISSWWCMIHGYKHPDLNHAIKSQVDQFAHVMLGGLNHEPAKKLSAKLADLLPGSLNHCFFSDSGSVGVEVAVKMGIQYYHNLGKKEKTKVLALKEAYHGDTFKAMEIGDDSDYHFAFNEKKDVYHIPTTIEALEEAIIAHHKELAIFIVEPLLQGAAGMKIYDVSFLERARDLCNQYDILLIFDEVATGFGRTGHMFVADLVCPDIIILGKALTGGYIGHAVTVATDRVYSAFHSDDSSKAFMHGPTFMGNPLACSVALKSIDLFCENKYLDKIKKIESIVKREMAGFKDDRIADIRIMGGAFCIEVVHPETLAGFETFAYERGIFNRPFIKYMYTMVPYIISEEELVHVLNVFKEWFEVTR